MHILIVDDYENLAEMVAETLRLVLPFEIETTLGFNGAQAVSLTEKHRPNVALLDIELPVLNGFSSALAIRSLLGSKAPLLIGMTSNPLHAASMKMAQTFDHVLPKPLDIDRLAQIITTRRARDQTGV